MFVWVGAPPFGVGFVRAEGGLVGGASVLVVGDFLGCWWCLLTWFVFRAVPVVQTGWLKTRPILLWYGSKTRMGLVLLTRKGLVTIVLNSSLDLSFYASV
jgi:hypothetical protein